jgi:hypothetical protein
MRRTLSLLLISIFWRENILAQIYNGTNGLSVSGADVDKVVQLGGVLNGNTAIDLGQGFNFTKNMSNYFSILNNGKIGLETNVPSIYAKFDIIGGLRAERDFVLDRQSGNLTSYFFVNVRNATEFSNFGNPLGNGAVEMAEVGTSGLILGSLSGNRASKIFSICK